MTGAVGPAVESGSSVSAWILAGALWLALVALMIAANPGTTEYVLHIWQSPDGAFGHSWLVLAISAWLTWRLRGPLLARAPSPSLMGLLFLGAVMLAWWLGYVLEIRVVQQLAMTAGVAGITWALLGNRVAWLLAFPLLYLFFTVSAWDVLSVPLQDVTAWMSAILVRALGVPLFRDGPYLWIPEGTFLVDQACSGLRYMMAALSIGALYAYLMFDDLWRRALFLAFAAAWAVLLNVIRVVMVVYAGHLTDMQHAWVDDHLMLGWILFAVMLPVLFFIGHLLQRLPPFVRLGSAATPAAAPPPARRTTARATLAMGTAAVVFLIAAPGGAAWFDARAAATSVHGASPEPPAMAGWEVLAFTAPQGGPRFPTADVQMSRAYRSPDGTVQFFLAWYAYERNDAKLLYFANRRFDRRQWRTVGERSMDVDLGGGKLPVREHVLRVPGGHGNRVLWSWYRVDAQPTGSPWHAKLLGLRGVLRGRPEALVVILAADGDSPEAARAQLQAFLTATPDLYP